MRLYNYLNERIEDFKPKEKRNIKRHLKKLEKKVKEGNLNWFDVFNSLYGGKKEKIKLIPIEPVNDNDIVVWADFLRDTTILLYINKYINVTDYTIKNIDNKLWSTIIKETAKVREKAKNLSRLEQFRWATHIPIKQHLIDEIYTNAYDASIELEDDGFSPTKSMYHDVFGSGLRNKQYYDWFVKLMNEYKNGERKPPPTRKLFM